MPEPKPKVETCGLSRQDELKVVATKFTKFLVEYGLISNAPIAKTRLRELYLRYQATSPSRIHVNEILDGLYKIRVVKKTPDCSAENPTIQFKPTLLPSVSDSGHDDELSKPRIRVLTNQAQTFKNRAPLEPDISGLKCRLCNLTFANQTACDEHANTNEHKLKSLYRNDRNKLKKSLPFLEITGVNTSIDIREKERFVVSLKNVSEDIHVEVKEVFILWNKDSIVPSFRVPVTLKKDEKFECTLDVYFPKYESHSYPLIVLVKNKSTMEIFHVLVESEFKVIDKSLHDLGASEPFQYPERNGIELLELPVIPGRPLPDITPQSYLVPLQQYKIPANLIRLLNRGFRVDANSKTDAAFMKELKVLLLDQSKERPLRNIDALNSGNYSRRMQHLLWMEEHQQNMDIHFYDQKDAILVVDKRGPDTFHKLEVPGLSENRPSILRGDELHLRQSNANRKYQGIVHLVEENFALLALNTSFNYVSGEKVSVEFSLNRLISRVCHRAVDLISSQRLFSIVFPSEFYQKPKNLRCPFKNPKVEENREQHRAVRNIVNNTAFPAPYIIYGPPGTGKTSTIVEAITQIALNVKSVRICACAPSNAAADLLALRLMDFVPHSSIYRVYSNSRSVQNLPQQLKGYCNLNERGTEFALPEFRVIASKSIVVVTPYIAGRIHGMGGTFYDYVFFDEAGHAEEPLTLIPAVGLLKKTMEGTLDGNLILAGDPKQLGPIIHSRLAAYFGLDMSLLERLMIQSSIYRRDPVDNEYDDRVITKLVCNYRSHMALLHVPNKLFYDNELRMCADVDKITALCSWDALPKKNFPIIFHGVRGSDEREKSSPSYFNLLEIQTVKQYIVDLTDTKVRGKKVQQQDIVVLTPYRKQVQKFRDYFRKAKFHNVEVKSVEEFQGQERKVVIISTVRSQQKFVSSDYQFGLGFLRNPKRFNVATTRAQALMIVVGNPDILQTDPCWRALIQYCIEQGGYKGERPKESVDDNLNPNDILTINLSSLTIKTEDMPESERAKFIRYE